MALRNLLSIELLQRTQEVQNVLLLGCSQVVEVVDHAVGFGAAAALSKAEAAGVLSAITPTVAAIGVRLDCDQQVAGPAVVQEEQALAYAP